MYSQWLLALCGLAIIGSGLVSGVFLAFSDFVMKALVAASPEAGIESMQIINRKVYGSIFLVLLMGMALVALLLGGLAYVYLSGQPLAWIMAGTILYLIGVFLVTMVFNVPMNQRLDAMEIVASGTRTYWANYGSSWTLWNHVRTAASAGSAISFLMGYLQLARLLA